MGLTQCSAYSDWTVGDRSTCGYAENEVSCVRVVERESRGELYGNAEGAAESGDHKKENLRFLWGVVVGVMRMISEPMMLWRERRGLAVDVPGSASSITTKTLGRSRRGGKGPV